MPSTGGFRKMRWAHARRGKGRQRWVANYLLPLQVGSSDMADDGFDKDEASDLNPKEKKALKTAIEGELAARAARRGRPRRSRRIC